MIKYDTIIIKITLVKHIYMYINNIMTNIYLLKCKIYIKFIFIKIYLNQ